MLTNKTQTICQRNNQRDASSVYGHREGIYAVLQKPEEENLIWKDVESLVSVELSCGGSQVKKWAGTGHGYGNHEKVSGV